MPSLYLQKGTAQLLQKSFLVSSDFNYLCIYYFLYHSFFIPYYIYIMLLNKFTYI
ncbi:Uncharacterised protein [Segatella copri]|nr:Uncharacterised protein [Segatella copri]